MNVDEELRKLVRGENTVSLGPEPTSVHRIDVFTTFPERVIKETMEEFQKFLNVTQYPPNTENIAFSAFGDLSAILMAAAFLEGALSQHDLPERNLNHLDHGDLDKTNNNKQPESNE